MIGFGSLVVGAPHWVWPALGLGSVGLLAVLVAYARSAARTRIRVLAATLKVLALLGLVFCLIEPQLSDSRPKAGANLFVVLADDSQSLQVRDPGLNSSRAEEVRRRLAPGQAWQTSLQQGFDVRTYAFDARLRPLQDVTALRFEGTDTALAGSLHTLAQRYRDRSVSGILLFTDGLMTDAEELERLIAGRILPPIFPVMPDSTSTVRDLHVEDISVSETNFEEAPVTILAHVRGAGYDKARLVGQLRTERGELVESQEMISAGIHGSTTFRFQFRPAERGVVFYEFRVRALEEGDVFERPQDSAEATLVNNRRWVKVNRGQGPYRVLYVAGRPNWEFKFLRRAVQADAEIEVVGLLRIAKREARFDFRGHRDEATNPLYRGFGNQQDEQTEQYDEPVLLRLGTRDGEELRSGFPRGAEELFQYDAVILDDVESTFFSRDQLGLLQQFVSRRGGGLMMLGGLESFSTGAYRHSPIADLLPVYIDAPSSQVDDDLYHLVVTREGLLQPWLRLRATEETEQQRLDSMPSFHVLNRIESVKPGAAVLAYVRTTSGSEFPAFVTQRFGKGRTLALTVGDLWRWGLHRPESKPNDLDKAWRQTVRWLVGDVPRRVEVEVVPALHDPHRSVQLKVSVLDPRFDPLDNAAVSVAVTGPDRTTTRLTAEPSGTEVGVYETSFAAPQAGAYRADVEVKAADGSDVAATQEGWTAEPGRGEFASLEPRRDLLQRLASTTGGEIVEPDDLIRFVADLPRREHVITETWIRPFWHQWWVFLLAAACLIGEWAVRRWQGLP
ncbi:MAG: glutamine amidotransferase [Pirellulaceae bacterium]